MQSVIETENYLRDAKDVGLPEKERTAIVDFIADNPEAGKEIKGTGGARKIRFAGKGKGKSGGYRVITFYGGRDIPVFLLNVFAKNEKADLTMAERHELKAVLAALARSYRKRS
jgi:mRNA-degrading endonuclease RelE of RelBE toxin-antitoxin system